MIYCNNCQSNHMASEAFCRSMNAPVAAHEQWKADRAAGIPEHEPRARKGMTLVGGPGKPSTHVMDRHQSPITLRDFNKPRTPVVSSEPRASEKQSSFILDLLASRVVPDAASARLSAEIKTGNLTKVKAHKSIEWLLRQAKVAVPVTSSVAHPQYDVPDGRYAIDSISGKNEIVFYRVTKNRNFYNVNMQISDNWVKVDWTKAQSVLRRIENAGWKDAMLRYGQELEQCGHCGKPLTDDESRARGVGPVCLAKYF